MTPSHSAAEIFGYLQKLPLLLELDTATLGWIAESVVLRRVAKRESVILKGSVGEHLMFLVEGRLQVFDITESGREIGLNFLSTGDYFGELSIIDGLHRSASVMAIEASLIAQLPKTQSLELFHQTPLVAERILRGLASKLRTASAYQTILCLSNASQRVFALLLHLSTVAPGGLAVIENLPRQQQLAIMANTSRETVSRAIKELTSLQILEKDNHRLIVRKLAQLQKLASNDAAPTESKRPVQLVAQAISL